ncbi:Appr-1-p processing protein [Agathobaculum butyriciproducens]|nr:Appr-1-p processing protein [Agathobaculum butyriciproducens]RGC59895.1 Appr-1-p processing protein [Agathobaculum butyriciproducens]
MIIINKKGDIFSAAENSNIILCHQVNCKGAMGAGFSKVVKEKYPTIEESYKRECTRIKAMREIQHDYRTGLGNVQFLPIPNEKLYVANMFAQNAYGIDKRQTDYDAFELCVERIKAFAQAINAENTVIRIPYGIGCGLAGGEWEVIEKIIRKCFDDFENENVAIEIWQR